MSTAHPYPHLEQLERDLARLDRLLADRLEPGWRRPVPACPGWDLAALVGHLGGVHRMVVQAVESGTPSHSSRHAPDPAVEPGSLVPWLGAGGRALLAVLDGDPSRPAWSFDDAGRTVGFWQRRQVMETLVHRVDVEQSLGVELDPVPADVAADGVAEVVDVMVRLRTGAGELVLPDHAVELHLVDTGDRLLIGTGDVVGRAVGPAAQHLLDLWKRAGPTEGLTLDGDVGAVRALLALPLTP